MKKKRGAEKSFVPVTEEDLAALRRALLLTEREQTRMQGRRKLERISQRDHPILSPVALAGLAASQYWAGDYGLAIGSARQTMLRYPVSAASVWCSSLVVTLFRMLGMRRERFEAEGERLRIMRKAAFESLFVEDRIYALSELRKELEARDLSVDAEKCSEELRDLMAAYPGVTGWSMPAELI